jgi:hypothetical protein
MEGELTDVDGTPVDFAELHEILQKRAAERNVRLPRRSRRLDVLLQCLSDMGIAVLVVQDEPPLARVRATSEPRDESRVHNDGVVTLEFPRRHFQRIGRMGGSNSRRYLSPAERRRLARKAAAVRWSRPRKRKSAG